MRQRRQADRQRADDRRSRSVPARSNTALTTVEPTTATRMPGIPGRHCAKPEDDDQARDADREGDRVRLAGGHAGHERSELSIDHAVAVVAEPEQPRELADDDDQRDAVEVAVADGRGQEVGQEAEPGQPGRDAPATPTMTASSAPSADRPVRGRRPTAGRSRRR